MNPGDKVTVQGTPATVVVVNNTMTPPSALVVLEIPQARWVPLSQINVTPPSPPQVQSPGR